MCERAVKTEPRLQLGATCRQFISAAQRGTVRLKDARQRKKGDETRVNICLFSFYSLYVICCLTIFASAAAPLALTVKVLGPQAKCEGRCLKPSASSTGSCEHFFFFLLKCHKRDVISVGISWEYGPQALHSGINLVIAEEVMQRSCGHSFAANV